MTDINITDLFVIGLSVDDLDRLVQGLLSIDAHLQYVSEWATLEPQEAVSLLTARKEARSLLESLQG